MSARHDMPWYDAPPPSSRVKEHRIYCEWKNIRQENWRGCMSSLSPTFQLDLVNMTEKYGPPTKVEFRADGEKWV